MTLARHRIAKVAWALYPPMISLRHRRHRQPLLVRRRRRRAGRRSHRRRGRAPARPAAAGRVGLARAPSTRTEHDRPHGGGKVTAEDGGRVAWVCTRSADRVAADAERDLDHRAGAEPRRGGPDPRRPDLPRRGRLHRRLDHGHARWPLFADVRQGNHVRRLPRLDPRPDRGGPRARSGRVSVRRRRQRRFLRPPAW